MELFKKMLALALTSAIAITVTSDVSAAVPETVNAKKRKGGELVKEPAKKAKFSKEGFDLSGTRAKFATGRWIGHEIKPTAQSYGWLRSKGLIDNNGNVVRPAAIEINLVNDDSSDDSGLVDDNVRDQISNLVDAEDNEPKDKIDNIDMVVELPVAAEPVVNPLAQAMQAMMNNREALKDRVEFVTATKDRVESIAATNNLKPDIKKSSTPGFRFTNVNSTSGNKEIINPTANDSNVHKPVVINDVISNIVQPVITKSVTVKPVVEQSAGAFIEEEVIDPEEKRYDFSNQVMQLVEERQYLEDHQLARLKYDELEQKTTSEKMYDAAYGLVHRGGQAILNNKKKVAIGIVLGIGTVALGGVPAILTGAVTATGTVAGIAGVEQGVNVISNVAKCFQNGSTADEYLNDLD